MFELKNIYRWCDDFGGGIVIASSIEDAREKLLAKFTKRGSGFEIWPWKDDDYFDKDHICVFDIYS